MPEVFDIGIKVLFILTTLFFLVFFYLCSLWSKPAHPKRRYKIGLMLSAIYTFIFFLIGTGILGISILVWKNSEEILNFIKFIITF